MSDTQRFVASIPPLSTIKDADTRRVLEALVSGWRTRNGDLKPDADERFITKGELKKLVEDVNSGYFTKGGAGFDFLREAAGGSGDLERYINDLLTATTNDILNNQLWTVLGERIPILEIPNIFTRMGRVETVVRDEMKIRSTADEAIIESVDALGVRVGKNEAGILTEKNLRVNSDNALVQAVNTIWAAVGSNSGIVQGGQEVVANTTGAVAQNWNQVQTALRDPLNGQILGVASVRDAAKATSDRITNRLTAERTIKVDVNGHVAGIGVIAEGDLTTGATTSAVIIRADKFAIGGVGGSTAVPFKVYTTSVAAPDGTVIPPGIYMDAAVVKELYGAYIGAGTLEAARIYSGSELIDRISKMQILSTAASSWKTDSQLSVLSPITSASLRFYAPYHHASGPVNQRIRSTNGASTLVYTVTASASVDHWFSLWMRRNLGSWQHLTTIQEDQGDYGSATLAISGVTYTNPGDYIDFGVTATDSANVPWNPSLADIYYLTVSASFVNI